MHKWTALHTKIYESKCDIICLQETKCETFDQAYVRNFCPTQFDCFEFIPSVGASGGTIIIWKSSKFLGQVTFPNDFAMNVEFVSVVSGASWTLTNIYASCSPHGKLDFLHWF
jgi:exonuclease III